MVQYVIYVLSIQFTYARCLTHGVEIMQGTFFHNKYTSKLI